MLPDALLRALPGVPESTLPEGVELPADTPAPPWVCRVEATLWWHRTTPAGTALVPSGLPRGLPVTVGAFVRYLDSPVGPYGELLGSPRLLAGALRRGVLARVHVPFIAVDSVASVHGGRAHWALPKTLAAFDGSQATGTGWQVSAHARARGAELPAYARLGLTQVDAHGAVSSSVTTARARVRRARVRVEVVSDGDLAGWLLPGEHRGLVLTGRMRVGPAGGEAGLAAR